MDQQQNRLKNLLQLSPIAQRRLVWSGTALAVAVYFLRFKHGAGAAIFTAAAHHAAWTDARHCGDLIYAYPPFFALLWTPFVPLPALLRVAVWYLVVLGTIFASLRICESLIRRSFPGK